MKASLQDFITKIFTQIRNNYGNVDNTSDEDKPISTAQQAEFDKLNSNLDTLAFGLESGSSNIIECEDISFLANTNKEIKIFELNLKAGTYTLSWTQSTTLTSIMRNTPFYIKNSSRIYMNGSENYNLKENRYKWTFTLESDSYIEMYYWCHTPNTDVAYKDFKLELGTQATSYEPYIPSVKMLAEKNAQQSTEAMDLKMLGWSVPSECPVQNYTDSNGVFHQRVGRVDLGSLSWIKRNDASLSVEKFLKDVPMEYKTFGTFCHLYSNSDWGAVTSNAADKCITLYSHNTWGYASIAIRDRSYTDADTFKNAMQGVYLYYELAEEKAISVDDNEAVTKVNNAIDELKNDLAKLFSSNITGIKLNGSTLEVSFNNGTSVGKVSFEGIAEEETIIS